jgi:20S proteasome subunit alpha 7
MISHQRFSNTSNQLFHTREAIVEAAKIMHKVHEEETKPFEIEMTWLCEESGMEHKKVPADVLAAAEAQAKAALRDDDM